MKIPARAFVASRFFAVALITPWIGGCDPQYDLEPTFCDDWCHATLSSGCEESPSNCVTDCELTRSSEDCFSLQRDLLDCYEQNQSALVCVGADFQRETRVEDGACETERDALFECEAPGISSCLSLCRVTQQDQLDDIVAAAMAPPSSEPIDAGATPSCPTLDQSCEGICWTLFSFSSEALSAVGGDPTDESDGDGRAASFTDSTQQCVSAALLGCFADGPLSNLGGDVSIDAGASDEPRSIADVIADCTFDAFAE